MRVILKDNVENLGVVGEVVDVKPGFARNYLLPKGLALVANESNVKEWEHQQRVVADRIRKLKLSAEEVGKQLKATKLEIEAKVGEGDRLFGSVGPAEIAKALHEKGFGISRRDIKLERPIKSVGQHNVRVKLHPEVSVEVSVEVVRGEGSFPPAETAASRTEEILAAAEKEEAASAGEEEKGSEEE